MQFALSGVSYNRTTRGQQMQDLIGRNIGPYQIVERLGRGGMASVYKAVQASLNRNVALKVLPPSLAADPTFVERFRREANAAASLQHPNILPIYDFGQDGETFYIAMMLVLGGTLRERIGRLSLPLACRIASQIADALDYAHARGIVHRDVKPTNILMAREDWAMLADFGIARLVEAQGLTSIGTGIGTPEYMSPEQALGRPVDGRADIYSLGVVLFEMVTGRQPFSGPDSFSIVRQHVETPLPKASSVNPLVPPAHVAIPEKATQKSPEQRYQTAAELKAALDRVAASSALLPPEQTAPLASVTPPTVVAPPGGAPPGAMPPPAVGSTPPPASAASPRRGGPNWLLIGIAAVVLLLCGCVGGFGALVVAGALFSEPEPVGLATATATRPPGTATPRTPTPAAGSPTRPPNTPTRVPPTPTTIPVGRVLFQDNMAANANGWDVVDNNNVRAYFRGGRYIIENFYPTSTNWQTTPRNHRTIYASLVLEADLEKLDGPDDKGYGIGFRLVGVDGYDFLIRGNGTYSLGRYVEALQRQNQAGYDLMIEPTRAPPGVINLGNAKNRLKVVARGNNITLYINDIWVADVIETKPEARREGTFGIVVGQNLTVAISAVRVFETR
ncbi:MAG: protein kinase [Dehalococcoidia bacterium]|nr:protein kinase [Dehalococcoidia bacterium]